MAIVPMKNPRFLLLPLFLTILTLSACSVVRVNQPVGTKPVTLDPAEWNGTWIADGDVVQVTAHESKKGILNLTWIETDEKENKPVAFSMPAHIRATREGWTYASILDPDGVKDAKGNSSHWWGRIEKLDDRILLWAPVPSKFADAVQEGKLPGKVDDDDVWLSNLKRKHLKFMEDENSPVLFAWDKPHIYDRIAD